MSSSDALTLFCTSISLTLPPILLTAASEPSPTLPLATYISFPQPSGQPPINLLKDAPTRYTAKPDSRDDFYSVGQIWLAWTERETGVREYLMKGQAGGVGYVGIADRRGVVEYLSGEGDGIGRVVGETEGQESATAPASTAASALVESIPSALTSAEAGPSRVAPAKRLYQVDVVDREFCRRLRAEEVELRDRNSVLRSSGTGKVNNFEPFHLMMKVKIKAVRDAITAAEKGAQPQTASQTVHDPSRPAKKARSNNPIIMISSSPTALITMWNVRKFLEQGIFEPSEVARMNEAAQGNIRAEDVIPIIRKRPGPTGETTSKCYVVDGVEALQKFGQDAWDRVICVLTTGQTWQFKPYKWQDPKALFRNVKGVYFQWNNEPANPAVKDWNVTEMRIDKAKRHTDRQVVADFWRILDSVKRR